MKRRYWLVLTFLLVYLVWRVLQPQLMQAMASAHLLGRIVISAHTQGEKLVALTFDDGPDPRFTPQILDILQQYRVPATFFVIGQAAQDHRDLLEREIAEGHEIANHTFSHQDMVAMNEQQIALEIDMTNSLLERITGKVPDYFRPPRGRFDWRLIEACELRGLRIVLWTVGIENHTTRTPEAMADRVVAKVYPGAIILGHDGRLNRIKTVQALPLIITRLRAQGYRFVTLSQLLDTEKEIRNGEELWR